MILLAAVTAVSLSLLQYQQRQAIERQTSIQIQDLKRLPDGLAQFQRNLIAFERLLYRCYLDNDSQAISVEMERIRAELESDFNYLIMNQNMSPDLNQLGIELNYLYDLGQLLSEVMVSGSNDPDGSEVLRQVSDQSAKIAARLETVYQSSQNMHSDAVMSILDDASALPVQSVLANLAIAIILASLLWYIRGYLASAGITKRLHQFPEKNPNPVLAFNQDGEAIYCNPATRQLAEKLTGDPADETVVLPVDIKQRLRNLNQQYDSWRYQVGQFHLEVRVQAIPEERRIHLYVEDITERVRAQGKVDFLAFHDAVTGLENRYQLEKDLQTLNSGPYRVLTLFRVGGISGIAALEGQRVLDALFEIISFRFKHNIRLSGLKGVRLYRIQDRQFALFFPDSKPESCESLVNEMVSQFDKPLVHTGREFNLECRAAIVEARVQDQFDDVISRCETALQMTTSTGRNVVVHNEDMTNQLKYRKMLENQMLPAISNGEFFMHFQPQIDIQSHRLIGVEALVRWQHPDQGLIPPFKFIDIAESSGHIVALGAWILEHCCAFWHELNRKHDLNGAVMAINLSARQFQHRGFLRMVESTLQKTGIDPATVELEITESLLMDNLEDAIEIMKRLKEFGVAMAIDDFGTGYSSLSYLSQFPVDKLKVDRSFVQKVPGSLQDESLVQAIINMGHALELKVIAEGAEEQEQVSWLHQRDCDEIQGYYFSKPLPKNELIAYIEQGDIRTWQS